MDRQTLSTRLDTVQTHGDAKELIADMLPQLRTRIPYMLETQGGQENIRNLIAMQLVNLPQGPAAAVRVGCSAPLAVADCLLVAATVEYVPVPLMINTAKGLLT